MGWNSGYTIFEAITVHAYDAGILNKELLTIIMERFRGTDIDEGGSHDLVTRDGKCVKEVVIETFGRKVPKKPPAQDGSAKVDDKWEKYHCRLFDAFHSITSKKFGWV